MTAQDKTVYVVDEGRRILRDLQEPLSTANQQRVGRILMRDAGRIDGQLKEQYAQNWAMFVVKYPFGTAT